MIRRPLRPLARILKARDEGVDPDLIEAQERMMRISEMRKAERKSARARLSLLCAVFVMAFATVAGRMALVSAAVPKEQQSQRVADPISSARAQLIDRDGAILATNIATYALYAQPRDMVDPQAAATGLAAIFPELNASELLGEFTDGRKFTWVRKTISPEQRQRVHSLGEPGLLFGPREMRLYPNGPVASHIVGGARFGREKVNAAEIIGLAGVERAVDDRLRDPALVNEPLRLSIDLDVQIAMEEILADGMDEMNARGAVGILMEADTGQIRAMASLPDFDPNRRPALPVSGDPADSPLFNRAVQGVYELGSTFKPFTVAQALEDGIIAPTTLVDTKGPMKWGRYTIRDYKNYGPHLTVEDIIVKSSNIGTARIALETGGAAQMDFLGRLGMTAPVPVELSEAKRARPIWPANRSDLTTMTISYGHGVAVSPLHLATAYCAIANGGYRVTPSIIETPGISKTDGDRIFSERTSRQLRAMLRQVVERGTAKRANVDGYELGGKTGTADKPKPGGGYARKKVISTFASVFPASDPEYVLVVALDEPTTIINKTEFRTAGLTAAPIAAKVVRRVAPILNMRPGGHNSVAEAPLYTLAGNQ